MIAPFRNHLPVKIRFGDGVAGDLAEVLAAEGSTRPFVIMDEGLDGFIPAVADALGAAPGAIRFEKAPGEPTVGLVEHAAATLADSGADAVVAIGGGSSMDTARAAPTCGSPRAASSTRRRRCRWCACRRRQAPAPRSPAAR